MKRKWRAAYQQVWGDRPKSRPVSIERMPDGCSRQDGAGERVTKRDGLPDGDGRQGCPQNWGDVAAHFSPSTVVAENRATRLPAVRQGMVISLNPKLDSDTYRPHMRERIP